MSVRYDQAELHAILLLTGGFLAVAFDSILVLNICALSAFVVLIVANAKSFPQSRWAGGLANWITGCRLLTLLTATTFYPVMESWVFAVLVFAAVVADGLDGWVARRRGEESTFGALFDLETDAYLAASVSSILFIYEDVTILVLFPGFLRYLFVLVKRYTGWCQTESVSFPEARLLAFLFFISLIAPFLIPWGIAKWILLGGCLGVIYSFTKEAVLCARLK